jgi:sporulation protein YlmC with PRC-barrel domain
MKIVDKSMVGQKFNSLTVIGFKKDKSVLEVPWRSVRKIGNDMIIIEYDGIY